MPLPSAPSSISMNQVNVELAKSGTAQIALNDTNVRTLFQKASGQISLSDGYGKASFWKSNLTKGFFSGGYAPGSPTTGTTTSDKITYSSDSIATSPTTNLTAAKYSHASVGTSDKGFFVGGAHLSVVNNTADKTTYSSDTTVAVPGANMPTAKISHKGIGTTDKGFFTGGSPTTSGGSPPTSTSDKITYSSDTTALAPGTNLSQARNGTGSVGTTDKGFISGGTISGTSVSTGDKITYSSETIAVSPGSGLTIQKAQTSAIGNKDKGYFCGGVQGLTPQASVDKITFSTETTASNPSSLSAARYASGAAGNSDKGYVGGGAVVSAPTQATRTDLVTYSSDTVSAIPTAFLPSGKLFLAAI